ncbi:uncharacterized protein [Dendrobates tinctorius]|uniref:uncharacterized protein isoform X4 n=1 Tax=Dendrobates tinctorius TaxID=92724 RepID=UPI003CC9C660
MSAGDHARHRERRRPCQTPRAPETMPDTESAGDHARHRERRRPCQTPRAPETMPDTESAGDHARHRERRRPCQTPRAPETLCRTWGCSLPGKQTTAAVYLVRIELNLTRIMRQV